MTKPSGKTLLSWLGYIILGTGCWSLCWWLNGQPTSHGGYAVALLETLGLEVLLAFVYGFAVGAFRRR